MKKINKLPLILMGLCLPAFVFAGCASKKEDAKPSIDGTHDIDCLTGQRVDLLDGVAAIDAEDGDITPDMKITSLDDVQISEDGYAVFKRTGEYKVTYSVKDSAGNSAEKSVTAYVSERTVYADFSHAGGFYAECGGGAEIEKCGMYDGRFRLKAAGMEVAEDLLLSRKYSLKGDTRYLITYDYTSDAGGKVYAYADGSKIAETEIAAGTGSLTFSYVSQGQGDVTHVLSLGLGRLGGELEFSLRSASYALAGAPQDETVIAIEDFSLALEDGYQGRLSSQAGAVTVEIPSFAANDGAQQLKSPAFVAGGDGGNFVVVFTAKASKPISAIIAIPKDGGWDPNLFWKRITIGETEQTFVFACDEKHSEFVHRIVWQFGSEENTGYHNVTIEISGVKICYKHSSFDMM